MKPKVFGIGFHKTGTSSLAAALQYMGYRVTGPNAVHNPEIAKQVYSIAFELVEQFDAFQDNPWPLLYRELDHQYPGSRFILTVRPTAAWIRSVVSHFGQQSTPMRQWIYGLGSPEGNEAVYVSRYEKHNLEVLNYFSARPNDLLVLKITEGEGWEKLCPFLDSPVINQPFPHENKQSSRSPL